MLSKRFVDAAFEFRNKALAGQPEQPPRWKRVLGTVNSGMGMALGQLYVAKEFKPEAKERAQVLVDNVRAALKARIEKLDWMSPETTKNLDAFLKQFEKYGAYYLVPVKLPDKPGEAPDLESKQYLLKGHIHVRPAWQIGEHDSDMVALDVNEDPVIPDGITHAPVLKAMARKRDRSGK